MVLKGYSKSEIMPFGHIFAHFPQPVQLSVLTLALPFSMLKALNAQALTQSPKPIQPYLQALGPPKTLMASLQLREPI